jgi:FKBP-type peptidyl-prolyl cis-trans isomerase
MITAIALASVLLNPMTQNSKLVIEDTKIGEGEEATAMDMVEVHYTGTLLDGKKFDSSLDRGTPFRFQLGTASVIKGWDQGVTGMKVGGIRELTIPSDLAYGDQGAGDVIPPKATLKFKISLLRVLPRTKIEVLQDGKGEGFKLGETLKCKLVIKALDGSDLVDSNRTMSLMLSRNTLPGLNQGIFGIKAGERRRLTINCELAFGKSGLPGRDTGDKKAGSMIAAGKDVVAEIEAVSISK